MIEEIQDQAPVQKKSNKWALIVGAVILGIVLVAAVATLLKPSGDNVTQEEQEKNVSNTHETIEDRHLGYKLTKPLEYKEYDFDYKDDVAKMYSATRKELHMNLGVEASKEYKVLRVYKDVDESVVDAYKRIVGTDNVQLYTPENSETAKKFSGYFPNGYMVFNAALQSGDTYQHGDPERRYLSKWPSKWVVYNPKYPDRYYVFDTSNIVEGVDLDNLEGAIDGIPWQASLRIIDGDSEFEHLNKSDGVPSDVYPYRVIPLDHKFTIRGDEYKVFTPGNTDSGYDFTKVLIRTEDEDREKENTIFNYIEVVTEAKEAMRPKTHSITPSESFPKGVDNYDFKIFGKDRRAKEPHRYFVSALDYFWFSGNWKYFVVAERSTINNYISSDNAKLNVTVFEYDWADTGYWEAEESTLNSTTTFSISATDTTGGNVSSRESLSWKLGEITVENGIVTISAQKIGKGWALICDISLSEELEELDGKNVVIQRNRDLDPTGCQFEFQY